MSCKILLLLAFTLSLLNCAVSPRWVEVESHTSPWPDLIDYRPPATVIWLKENTYILVSPEGFSESKTFAKNALEISGKDTCFQNPDRIYSVYDGVQQRNKRGTIYLDEVHGKAKIDLQEEFKDTNGILNFRKCRENGTYDIKSWIIDGKPKTIGS